MEFKIKHSLSSIVNNFSLLFYVFFIALLASLSRGVTPAWSADYNKQVLTNEDFSHQDLTDASFDHTNLRGSDFSFANLAGVRLSLIHI